MNKLRVKNTLTMSIMILMMASIPLFASTHSERASQKEVIKMYDNFELLKEQGDKIKVGMFNYTLEYVERIDNTNNYKATYVLKEEIHKTFDNLETFKEFGDKLQFNELKYTLMTLKRIDGTEKLIATYVLEQ